ncbi:MAG: tetratricopeptide repeat protein, partial [Anaerolineales bacterium]
MAGASLNLSSIPEDFQNVIQLAEEQHGIAITALQELSGGRSGALLYLVRVAGSADAELKHLILKLDRKHPKSSADEISRHLTVQEESPSSFVENHIPTLSYERVELEGALAIFYTIAGQSLRSFRTLSGFRRQSRLEHLFSKTNEVLLDTWNPSPPFRTIGHPQELLANWLGFRLKEDQNIETFIREVCQLPVDTSGFIHKDNLLPNPLLYARKSERWGSVRALDAAFGHLHRDLNTNNILAKFSQGTNELEAYFLIDFALFKPDKPLLYDHRYLEMSYLIDHLSDGSFDPVIELINRYSESEILDTAEAPIEVAGVNAAIRASRLAFADWIEENHPSLQDDLWGQYWLAGAAAGLGYCHKSGMSNDKRLASLIYAAANLKQFFRLFDLAMPSEAGELYDESGLGRESEPPIPGAEETPNNLPAPLTNFVGREQEIQEVTELLLDPETRLVSLTGAGGSGKTRLAQEVGRNILEEFPEGVFFIDLSDIRDPDLVIPTTAHTLGLREGGGHPPLDKLKNFLSRRHILLIFDNFEHVVEAAPDLSELLVSASELTVLVTSRVSLQLRSEVEYLVTPLEVPPASITAVEEIRSFASAALFEQRVQSVKPAFEINEENKAAVADICRRLEGLPLAIELAAARVKMLTPEALLVRLDESLDFLVGQAEDLPDRQKTLREAIDWSFQLLDPAEQDLFIRLGVFSGGFTLEAADEICPSMEENEVFDGVETLLNENLVRQISPVTGDPRFDMLQPIREFAQEKAAEQGVHEELMRLHCAYFTDLASMDLESGIYGTDSALWLQIYEQEHDNMRQAMDWALDHPEENVESLLAMMTQLSWFWYRHGHLQEGSEWMERALQVTKDMGKSPPRAFALFSRASLALWSGDLKLAAKRCRQALEISQQLELDRVTAFSKMTYGIVLVNQGKDEEAYPYLLESLKLYDDLGLTWMQGTSMVHLANVSLGLGEADQALEWLDKSRSYMNKNGEVWYKAFVLSNYGEVARAQENYEEAEEYYRRTEDLYQQTDSKGDQARLITVRGYLAQHKGERDKAKTLFLESLNEFRKLGNQRGIAESLAGLACLAAE